MELNRERIIKALECCTDGAGECDDCPLIHDNFCGKHLLRNALSLIKELPEDNEAISERYAIQVVTAIELDKQVQRLTEENERLRSTTAVKLIAKPMDEEERKRVLAELKNAPIMICNSEEKVEVIEADTVRKYREQLHRAFAHSDSKDKFNKGVFLEMVDLIAKEMIGEGK